MYFYFTIAWEIANVLAHPPDIPPKKPTAIKITRIIPPNGNPFLGRCRRTENDRLRERVAIHEVYTGKREIKAMLDLVQQETERIDSKFLEPACGTNSVV